MREILFRGKLVSNGEWTFGNIIVNKKGACIITPNKTPLGKYGQVTFETVGQYTGLTDKNGVKIFEGDICEFRYDEDEKESPHLVKWFKERACFVIIEIYKNKLNGGTENLDEFFAENCKIISNIHDNPELLKGA